MKKAFLFFAIMLFFGGSCSYFEECDGDNYQIRYKEELGNGKCVYRAQSITSCLTWNNQRVVEFQDSCGEYLMSQIVRREVLSTKYGI